MSFQLLHLVLHGGFQVDGLVNVVIVELHFIDFRPAGHEVLGDLNRVELGQVDGRDFFLVVVVVVLWVHLPLLLPAMVQHIIDLISIVRNEEAVSGATGDLVLGGAHNNPHATLPIDDLQRKKGAMIVLVHNVCNLSEWLSFECPGELGAVHLLAAALVVCGVEERTRVKHVEFIFSEQLVSARSRPGCTRTTRSPCAPEPRNLRR
mmetsp:Transcript_5354/g.17343  ORF Transcript_5354/g.17343 Transcript_5354/m.17343 type:complete len:206 (+) Transcript_5354:553-1170(+)